MSTRGQHQIIRKLCDELNIIELPEKGVRIGDLGYGWDGQVHDTATSGRKNPTQLIIDAFIKGISWLTVGYGSASDREMMEETIEAGNILGLNVNIGFEFSVKVGGLQYHSWPNCRIAAQGRNCALSSRRMRPISAHFFRDWTRTGNTGSSLCSACSMRSTEVFCYK